MVMGFNGWPNGGQVSTGVLTYLISKLEARKMGEITSLTFYDLTIKRPHVKYHLGVLQEYKLPSNVFYYTPKISGKELILFLGDEPSFRWVEYVEAIMHVVKRFNVKRVYTIGGLLDRVPHTVEPLITFAVNFHHLAPELEKIELEPTNYEGPSSIHSMILYKCREEKVEAVSLWGHSPYYLSGTDVKTIYHVVSKLLTLLRLSLDVNDLRIQSEEFRERIDMEVNANSELKELLSRLEIEYQLSRRRPSYVG